MKKSRNPFSHLFFRLLFFIARVWKYLTTQILLEWRSAYYTHLVKSCGPNLRVNGKLQLLSPKTLEIGENVHLCAETYINAAGGVRIGDNCHISKKLTINSQNHDYEGSLLPYDQVVIKKPVSIEKNVWIGMGVTIAPGTTIGEGAIIGSGTSVAGVVPPYAIVASAKVRVIGQRNSVAYQQKEQEKKYSGPSGRPYKK